MQAFALRQFSRYALRGSAPAASQYRLLCALLLAVWLLFQLLRAAACATAGILLNRADLSQQLLWAAGLMGLTLLQLLAEVPLLYRMLACCLRLTGLPASPAISLRKAYALQLLVGCLRFAVFLPVPLLCALGYRCLQTAAWQPEHSTAWMFGALHCLAAALLLLIPAIQTALTLGASPILLLQNPKLPLLRIPRLAVVCMRGHLGQLFLVLALSFLRLPLLWRIPQTILESTLCYAIPLAQQRRREKLS